MFSVMRIQEGFYCVSYKWLKEIHNHFLSGFHQKSIDYNALGQGGQVLAVTPYGSAVVPLFWGEYSKGIP